MKLLSKCSEFDEYAPDYSGGNEDPLKRFFGPELDHFIRVKAKWLSNFMVKEGIFFGENHHLLDYGCGTGEMLKWLTLLGFRGCLQGADISHNMIEAAKERWQGPSTPLFTLVEETQTTFQANTFDCIVVTCVFHHIKLPLRNDVLLELKRILKPNGKIVVFEHNPYNPLTRLIVKRAVIDRNAILLYPREMILRFRETGMQNNGIRYLMFFPPGLKFFDDLDRFLGWCPLGGQYAAVATRTN